MTRIAVSTLIFLGVWGVFTAVFAASAPKAQVRLMPKWIWVILCVIVPFFGGLLYLMVGRPLAGGTGSGAGGSRGTNGGTRRQPKVVAPDDDPRFLRDLEKKLREQAEREHANDDSKPDATQPDATKPEDENPDPDSKPKEA